MEGQRKLYEDNSTQQIDLPEVFLGVVFRFDVSESYQWFIDDVKSENNINYRA